MKKETHPEAHCITTFIEGVPSYSVLSKNNKDHYIVSGKAFHVAWSKKTKVIAVSEAQKKFAADALMYENILDQI